MDINSGAVLLYLPVVIIFVIAVVVILRLTKGSTTSITIKFLGMSIDVVNNARLSRTNNEDISQ